MGSDHHRHAWCGAPRPDSDDVSGGQVILPVLSMAIYLWFQCLKVPYIVWFFDFVIIHQHGDFSYLIEGFTTQNDPKCRFDVFKGWCKKKTDDVSTLHFPSTSVVCSPAHRTTTSEGNKFWTCMHFESWLVTGKLYFQKVRIIVRSGCHPTLLAYALRHPTVQKDPKGMFKNCWRYAASDTSRNFDMSNDFPRLVLKVSA